MANILISNPSGNIRCMFPRPNATYNGTQTIGNAGFGQLVYVTASTANTLSLPDVSNAGQIYADYIVDLHCANTSNAITTIDSPDGFTINGQASIAIGGGDSMRFYTNGSAWFLHGHSLQIANFRAYVSSNQTLPATGSSLLLPCDTENFDIGGFFNNTAGNYSYTPKLPGKYRVYAQADLTLTLATPTIFTIAIYKNGAPVTVVNLTLTINGGATLTISDYISMNGSTDVLTVVVSQNGATTQTVNGTTQSTFFTASRESLF